MRHYIASEWKDYMEGRVGKLETMLMEEHLAGCGQCTEAFVEALGASGRIYAAPTGLKDRIMRGIRSVQEDMAADHIRSMQENGAIDRIRSVQENGAIDHARPVGVSGTVAGTSPAQMERAPDSSVPPQMVQPAMRAGRKARRETAFRYAVAAFFALVLWHSGFFGALGKSISALPEQPVLGQRDGRVMTGGFGDRMVGHVNNFFNNIEIKGDAWFHEIKK